MENKIIIGIDPGAKGALVVMDMSGRIIDCLGMPETTLDIYSFFADAMCDAQRDGRSVVAYLEKVGGMPGQGGSSMFNFGRNYGHLECALLASKIKFITVTPQKWQKHYQLGGRKEAGGHVEWKRVLKAKAQQLFPDVKVTLVNADALLIAEYGRIQEK